MFDHGNCPYSPKHYIQGKKGGRSHTAPQTEVLGISPGLQLGNTMAGKHGGGRYEQVGKWGECPWRGTSCVWKIHLNPIGAHKKVIWTFACEGQRGVLWEWGGPVYYSNGSNIESLSRSWIMPLNYNFPNSLFVMTAKHYNYQVVLNTLTNLWPLTLTKLPLSLNCDTKLSVPLFIKMFFMIVTTKYPSLV